MDRKSKIIFFSTPGNTSRITADLLDAIKKTEAVQVMTAESPHLLTGKRPAQQKSEQEPPATTPPNCTCPSGDGSLRRPRPAYPPEKTTT